MPGKKNLYIACADRWLPQYMHLKYEEYEEMYNMIFAEDKDEIKFKEILDKYSKHIENTSIADYVWLPLKFEEPSEQYPDGRVYIEWLDEWRIEDYE